MPVAHPSNAPILQVLAAYKAAVYAKDVDAFAALYDADVVVFDMWSAWSCSGLAGWREMAAGWFGSLGDERVVVEFDDVKILGAPELAAVHAFVTYRGLSAAGAELRSMNNRITAVLRHADGAWRIAHEHTSAPIDHETLKASLAR